MKNKPTYIFYILALTSLIMLVGCKRNQTEDLLNGKWNAIHVLYQLGDTQTGKTDCYGQSFKQGENVWIFDSNNNRIYGYENGAQTKEYTTYVYANSKIIIDYGCENATWFIQSVNEKELHLTSVVAIDMRNDSTAIPSRRHYYKLKTELSFKK